MSTIYRGYEIEQKEQYAYSIKLNGQVIASQPTEDMAMDWIDKKKKEQKK